MRLGTQTSSKMPTTLNRGSTCRRIQFWRGQTEKCQTKSRAPPDRRAPGDRSLQRRDPPDSQPWASDPTRGSSHETTRERKRKEGRLPFSLSLCSLHTPDREKRRGRAIVGSTRSRGLGERREKGWLRGVARSINAGGHGV